MSDPNLNTFYNFGSGPGMMPPSVLQQAQAEMLNWQGTGMSVWEIPFTGSYFQQIADEAKQDLRELLSIPEHFQILFMQGGASAQFSLVPMNLLGNHASADYIHTGYWSAKAIKEARRYCSVNIAASSESSSYRSIPSFTEWQLNSDAAYCHITSNETANGLQFTDIPDTESVPLVADMTSDFLSKPIDFERFGLIYAGAQKNIGPAGLTIVLIREDLIRDPINTTPSAFSYKTIIENNGRFNTPLTYGVYLAGLVFKHLKSIGGLEHIQIAGKEKSSELYRVIEQTEFYLCKVKPAFRSTMNHCFTLRDLSKTEDFISCANRRGLINLTGHPDTGGIRASVYNAMPMDGVKALTRFMQQYPNM